MPADAAAVPHVPPPPELVAALRVALAQVSVAEPLAVTEAEAAKLLGCSYKTVADLPGHRVGRFYLGRAKRYRLEDLRRYVAELVKQQAEN